MKVMKLCSSLLNCVAQAGLKCQVFLPEFPDPQD